MQKIQAEWDESNRNTEDHPLIETIIRIWNWPNSLTRPNMRRLLIAGGLALTGAGVSVVGEIIEGNINPLNIPNLSIGTGIAMGIVETVSMSLKRHEDRNI